MATCVPLRYREVAFTAVDVPLRAETLAAFLVGREAYRRTRFIVAQGESGMALVRVRKQSDEPLFSPIVAADLLAGPEETEFVTAPGIDVGVPSQLARAAARARPGTRCVVVQGLYEHVTFILNPDAVPVRVVDVAPPYPAKLVDQAERVASVAEELPPVSILPGVIDLTDLALRHPARHYLFPCRGSGAAPLGSHVSFLDEHPREADWVLVGCERSREIHQHFYGRNAPVVEMCPRELLATGGEARGPVLTKCCRLEEEIDQAGLMVVVPWGATLGHVQQGLKQLVAAVGPSWVRE